MNRALIAPLLLSTVFAATALAELSGREAPLSLPAPRFDLRPVAAPMRSVDGARDAQTILARPLFSADRRPASVKGAAAVGSAPPRLSAIMVSAAGRSVVFDDGGKPILARVGGRAGPYLVTSIADDQVTVMSPEGPRTLKPVPLPADASSATESGQSASSPAGPMSGLSILQQLQRGQVPHYAVPPPPSIQTLIARMRQH